MSIRFPKACKTRAERSAHASRVATVGWAKRRAVRPDPVWLGGITFDGPLAAGVPMLLDLYHADGERKWRAYTDGQDTGRRVSERGVVNTVRALLRAQRECAA